MLVWCYFPSSNPLGARSVLTWNAASAAAARFKKDLKKRKVPLEDYTVSGTSLTLLQVLACGLQTAFSRWAATDVTPLRHVPLCCLWLNPQRLMG